MGALGVSWSDLPPDEPADGQDDIRERYAAEIIPPFDHDPDVDAWTGEPVRLTRRSLPDRLRYFAAQLRQGTNPDVIAAALDATAVELDADGGEAS